MTYISRRSRIIVSGWTDECDADYILRAVRKRSDGRIKRFSSCDDLRAWVNDYCVNHEYLVDLMSDGEFSDGPPFRLFGRFIPVPILFKLMQTFQNDDVTYRKELKRGSVRDRESRKEFGKSANENVNFDENPDTLNENENADVQRKSSFSRINWEKNRLEKNLYDSTNLLNFALCKLEKIDNIIDLAKDESENAKNEEIQYSCRQSQANCGICPPCPLNDSNVSEDLSSSRTYIKKLQDSVRCNELLRKISCLREKLNKIQECRQKIVGEIHRSRVRGVKCDSSNQVTELYSRREETHVRKLKKMLEKLISERGRLVSEMCEAVNDLNTLRRNSMPVMSRQRNSRMDETEEKFKNKLGESSSCACRCDCSITSCEFDKYNSDSPSESDLTECIANSKRRSSWNTYSEIPADATQETSASRQRYDCSSALQNSDGLPKNNWNDSCTDYNETTISYQRDQPIIEPPHTPNRKQAKSIKDSHRTSPAIKIQSQQNSAVTGRSQHLSRKGLKPTKLQNISDNVKKNKNQSKVNFANEESPCRKKFYQEDFSLYEGNLTAQQQKLIHGAVKKIENRRSQFFNTGIKEKRPRSSPTTDRERHTVSAERRRHPCVLATAPERRVKSETTMQEIEKTLRNYEQRLQKYDALEHKIEQIRQKVLEMNRLKQVWQKRSNEGYKELELERGKSSKEIKKLSTENWALKRQVQRLMAKFEIQCKKIQTLKCNAQKNWELECETEELKKELMKYRDKFEHQQKCLTEWESVVFLQRKEIENLMNYIRRKSTPESNYSAECPSLEKKSVQRSRSYSPELLKPQMNLRPNTCVKVLRSSSDDESECSNEYPKLEYACRNQQKSFSGNFYSQPPCRRLNW